jgi:hypothetical protein
MKGYALSKPYMIFFRAMISGALLARVQLTIGRSGLLSNLDCCQIRTAVKSGLLSIQDCCQYRTAVKSGLLSIQDCCQYRTAVNTGLLSIQDCCQYRTAVKSGLLSNLDCCQTWTAVNTGLLSNQDCCQTWTAVKLGLLSKRFSELITGQLLSRQPRTEPEPWRGQQDTFVATRRYFFVTWNFILRFLPVGLLILLM